MKLFLEDEDGRKHEIKGATWRQEGDIILLSSVCYREEEIRKMERNLSRKLKRKVVILDGRFREVLVIPPCRKDPEK